MRRYARSIMLFVVGGLLLMALPACSQNRAETQPAQTQAATAKPHDFTKWEKEISALEELDRQQMPPRGGVLFVGSSGIRLWKTLATDFPEHQVINRGFGGSEIVDSTHFAERIIFPYEPRMIVFRAGGNDIHAGKSAAQVFADYQGFVAKVHKRLPKTVIVFISWNSSPSRWAERNENKALNDMVLKFSRGKRYLKYVETYDMTITPDGQPRRELFVADMLHFNADGYKLLAERVRPVLPKK
jgi:lysophospholipase L1-like esterase